MIPLAILVVLAGYLIIGLLLIFATALHGDLQEEGYNTRAIIVALLLVAAEWPYLLWRDRRG
jgi:uncharacterized membrane protein YbhN (UPF0104 family)